MKMGEDQLLFMKMMEGPRELKKKVAQEFSERLDFFESKHPRHPHVHFFHQVNFFCLPPAAPLTRKVKGPSSVTIPTASDIPIRKEALAK